MHPAPVLLALLPPSSTCCAPNAPAVLCSLRRAAVRIPHTQAHKHKLALLKRRDESLRSAQDYLYQGSEYLQRRCSAALGPLNALRSFGDSL